MRRLVMLTLCTMLSLACTIGTVQASSLDAAVAAMEEDNTVEEETTQPDSSTVDNQAAAAEPEKSRDEINQSFINGLSDAANATAADSETAVKVTSGVTQVVAIIIQILSYIIVAMLGLRVLCDLAYIAIPPMRWLLAGNAAAGVGAGQPGANGMGGMSTGYGSGGYGMGGYSRYGGGGYGMGGMGGIGGMSNGMNQQMPQGQRKLQLVSWAAIRAVENAKMGAQDGSSRSALALYVPDMIIVLVLTPILLVLAISGTLTDLGFFIAQQLVSGISSIQGMV